VEGTTVAIVGAGPAGLAVGACLRKAGVDFVILEKEKQVGSSWRRHYERLHLHTINRFSALPLRRFDKDYPRYVSRAQMVRYLESYTVYFDIEPRFGENVRSVSRDGTVWAIQSTTTSIHAPFIVVASGMNAEPVMPEFPGHDVFRGKLLHSAQYANAAPFNGQSVLVIGMGNSGAEIALDLLEGGAQPTISVRDGVHMVPRDLFGTPIQLVAMAATKMLPIQINDALFPIILDLALGNLSKAGIRRPAPGILEQVIRRGKIPVLDVGTAKKISQGSIRVMPGVDKMTEEGVLFSTGEMRPFDAIILATGYRANYRSFLPEGIQPSRQDVENSGIYFVGFHSPVTGQLRQIGKEAIHIADDVARRSAAALR
jgi:hypothetical protein